MIDATPSLDQLSAQQLREMVSRRMGEVRLKQVMIDKLTHEMAVLKRLKFAARSEAFSAQQHSLLGQAPAVLLPGA
jgi:hypothetical protein